MTLTFLSHAEQRAVLLERKVNLDEVRASEKLDDHAGGDDGGGSKFHEDTPVGDRDNTYPVDLVI